MFTTADTRKEPVRIDAIPSQRRGDACHRSAAADTAAVRPSTGEAALWEGLGGMYFVGEQAGLHGGVLPHYLVDLIGIGVEDADAGSAAAIADGADDPRRAGQVQGVIALAVLPDQIRYPAFACRARFLKAGADLENADGVGADVLQCPLAASRRLPLAVRSRWCRSPGLRDVRPANPPPNHCVNTSECVLSFVCDRSARSG